MSTNTDGPIEEIILNWTDLTGKKTGATALGSNKFYKGSIFQNGNTFKVVFNYGRVGQAGQTQEVSAATLDAARKALNKKIDEKVAKGYTRIEMRSEKDELDKAKSKGVELDKPKTKAVRTREFHPEVEALLKILYGSTGAAVAAGLSSTAGATKDAPLGNLSDKQLDKGADILDDAEKLIQKKGSKNDFVDLTNDFFSNIPRNIDHARKGGRLNLDAILLNDAKRIEEQRTFIGLLRDAFLQKEVFAKAAEVDDPTEVWYDGLKCDIEHVDAKSDYYKYVKNLFEKGQSPKNSNFYNLLKLGRVWKCEQQGRKAGFEEYAGVIAKKAGATGVVPGWHGTRTENLMGICKTGLLMPENLPKGVHITGRAFGLGIYHTPCWLDSGDNTAVDENGKKFTRHNGALKSLNYSSLRGAYYHHGNTANFGYMFLEELALGVPELALQACFNKPRPNTGCDYIYARAHGHQSLANDEVVTFSENASRRVAILEVTYKK
ncbi:MAG: WGR domain-containing protein [Myxococcales bacterium]|nr:WGR domain-containing protein [Myxococcales bacterium]